MAIDIWNWYISRNIHLSISHVAGCLNVEADELSRGLNINEDIEWALVMDIFQEIVCRFGKPDIDLFASRLNHKLENTFHLDQILMQWQWMLFQYLGLNNMSIFLHLSAPSVWFYGRLWKTRRKDL